MVQSIVAKTQSKFVPKIMGETYHVTTSKSSHNPA